MRLLRRHWRASDEQLDLRQDIYVKLNEAVAQGGLPEDAAAYLFTVARNHLIDKARRAQVVPIETIAELEALNLMVDDFSPERLAGARSDLRRLQVALDNLPPRCREVVMLRKIEGLSQRDIAQRLGIAEGTVEKQITLGIRSLAQSLFSQGIEVTSAWTRRLRAKEPDA